jgi:hypothetical protein
MPLRLTWPTQFPGFMQEFGVNRTGVPDFYTRHGLPAHEGVDFFAPSGTEIYACADGVVVQISGGLIAPHVPHPYGIHIRISHKRDDGDYETIYGHLLRARDGLKTGDRVKAGELIALGDNTGNSRGDHLHLTLKKKGATSRGETKFTMRDGSVVTYPRDIMNPTPFLDPFGTPPAREEDIVKPVGQPDKPKDPPAPPPAPKLVDNLAFVSDITIPDESVLPPGGAFTKTWGVRNNGTSTWSAGYVLRHVKHTNLAGLTEVPLPAVKPGESASISLGMSAPAAPGRYISNWQAFGPDGRPFGVVIFTIIRVVG